MSTERGLARLLTTETQDFTGSKVEVHVGQALFTPGNVFEIPFSSSTSSLLTPWVPVLALEFFSASLFRRMPLFRRLL